MKRVIAVLLMGSALGLAACGGGEDEPAPAAAASTPAVTTTPEAPAKPPAKPKPLAKAPAKPKPPAAVSVAIEGFAFAPATIEAKVGQKITWTNDDAAPHTVTAKAGGELDSGSLAQGASFSFTPTKAGTIAYFCAIHPSMVGTIDVS
jgi:plastocyanin